MKYDVGGRTVAITGASGGLGRALAEALRARKANLVLLDLDGDAVAEQAERLGGARVARGWQVDVCDLDSLKVATREAAEHFGRLDVVIAGAGVGNVVGPLATTEPAAWERTIDINLNGVWRTFKAAAPFVQQQRGHLLAIASMASFVHSPLHGSYTASKAGVWALCDSLRLEFRALGVTVGSVHPTFFKTPMVEEALADPAALRLWNDFEGLFKLVPLETVVNDIVRGIERRSAHVVSPRRMRPAALAPGLLRHIVDRLGFPEPTVSDAIELGGHCGAGGDRPQPDITVGCRIGRPVTSDRRDHVLIATLAVRCWATAPSSTQRRSAASTGRSSASGRRGRLAAARSAALPASPGVRRRTAARHCAPVPCARARLGCWRLCAPVTRPCTAGSRSAPTWSPQCSPSA